MNFFCTIGILLFGCGGALANSILLDEENWYRMTEGEWMVKFHAPWCPACKALIEPWSEFSKWSRDLDINVGEVDVTDNPGLSGRFLVTALPTVYHVKDGVFRQYVGSREHKDFIDFIEDKKWEQLEPIPSWKRPTDIHMAALGQFFKLSMMLRNVHNSLQDDYGLPVWASYGIFALITIITGCILGLMIVCCIDLVWPPKAVTDTSKATANGKKTSISDGDKKAEEDKAEADSDDVDGDASADEQGEGSSAAADDDDVGDAEEEKASEHPSSSPRESPGDDGVRQRTAPTGAGEGVHTS